MLLSSLVGPGTPCICGILVVAFLMSRNLAELQIPEGAHLRQVDWTLFVKPSIVKASMGDVQSMDPPLERALFVRAARVKDGCWSDLDTPWLTLKESNLHRMM